MSYHIIIAGLKRGADFNNLLRSEYALDIMDCDYGGRQAIKIASVTIMGFTIICGNSLISRGAPNERC
jgi:hypothetical protein